MGKALNWISDWIKAVSEGANPDDVVEQMLNDTLDEVPKTEKLLKSEAAGVTEKVGNLVRFLSDHPQYQKTVVVQHNLGTKMVWFTTDMRNKGKERHSSFESKVLDDNRVELTFAEPVAGRIIVYRGKSEYQPEPLKGLTLPLGPSSAEPIDGSMYYNANSGDLMVWNGGKAQWTAVPSEPGMQNYTVMPDSPANPGVEITIVKPPEAVEKPLPELRPKRRIILGESE